LPTRMTLLIPRAILAPVFKGFRYSSPLGEGGLL
jgi:hypothetical protein